ncbi:MAG: hypothetical protein IJK43_05635 [Prevotella sp.]|nr:hypothetical protein [Prevotella sp.]
MKKLYSTLLVLGLLIAAPGAMFAQSSSGSLYVGYAKYDDQLWEYDGVMLNKDSKVGCAILITKDMIAPYAGGTIKGMRVGWGTTQMNGEYEGFVRNDFNGEDLSTGKATVKYSYSDSNPGWNTMTMTDYVIPDDVEQLVVGFTTNVKSGVYAIPTIYPHYTKNSCYLWVDGDNDEEGNPRWVDRNEYGILPILLIVEDTQGTFSLIPVITMLTPNGLVTAGEPSDCLMRLKNAGSQSIRSIEVTSRQGEQTYSKKVNLSSPIAAGKTSGTFLVPLTCFESGDVELSITKVNDKELTKPVTKTVNILAVPKEVAEKYSRRPLMEYFESENNYRSARYYDEYITPLLEPVRNELTFVCQHLDDQFMTGDDDATMLALQLCDNDSSRVSIPAMTVDRAMNTGNILVQMSSTTNPMFDVLIDPTYFNLMLDAAKAVPTFASVEAKGNAEATGIAIEVNGEVAEGVLPEGEKPRLTVYLMERDVFSDSQMFWTEKEKEEHIGEYTHVNVIREILADGVELPATGTYSWDTTVDDPDPMWNTENLYIVAFVHRDGQKGGKYMHVFNSTEGSLSISDGINTIDQASAASAVYDLSGRKLETGNQKLETLPKGLYIVNGKKFVVK